MLSNVNRSDIGIFYREVIDEYTNSVQLSVEEQEWLTKTKSVDDLLTAVQQVHEARETGKKQRPLILRVLRRTSDGICRRLVRFSDVIDTFVSSNPNIATLIWGSIKLLLMVKN